MIVELMEQIRPDSGTMYAVVGDGTPIKWFANKDTAEKFYNAVLADPIILKTQTNILKSEEINVSLDK